MELQLLFLLVVLRVENIPEPQGLVAGARQDRLARRTDGQVEHPECMAGQSCDLLDRSALPVVTGVPQVYLV